MWCSIRHLLAGEHQQQHSQDHQPGDLHQQRYGNDHDHHLERRWHGGRRCPGRHRGRWNMEILDRWRHKLRSGQRRSARHRPCSCPRRPSSNIRPTARIARRPPSPISVGMPAAAAPGGRADLSQPNALGGTTAFSLFSDTASLTVNSAPVLTVASPTLGSTPANSPLTVNLTGTFINNGSGTTTVTDADQNAVVGGIAVLAVSGDGTWQYSTDGTTFQAIEPVSDASALLLSKTDDLALRPGRNGYRDGDYYLPRLGHHQRRQRRPADLSQAAPWAAPRPSAPPPTRAWSTLPPSLRPRAPW